MKYNNFIINHKHRKLQYNPNPNPHARIVAPASGQLTIKAHTHLRWSLSPRQLVLNMNGVTKDFNLMSPSHAQYSSEG